MMKESAIEEARVREQGQGRVPKRKHLTVSPELQLFGRGSACSRVYSGGDAF